MDKQKPTSGPWDRAGDTIYALMHNGWRKGVEQFKNRVTISASFDRSVTADEAEATLALIQGAPAMFEVLAAIAGRERHRGMLMLDCEELCRIDAAIARATGQQES